MPLSPLLIMSYMMNFTQIGRWTRDLNTIVQFEVARRDALVPTSYRNGAHISKVVKLFLFACSFAILFKRHSVDSLRTCRFKREQKVVVRNMILFRSRCEKCVNSCHLWFDVHRTKDKRRKNKTPNSNIEMHVEFVCSMGNFPVSQPHWWCTFVVQVMKHFFNNFL